MRLHPQLLSQMRLWAFGRAEPRPALALLAFRQVRLFRSDLCARRTDPSETSAGGASRRRAISLRTALPCLATLGRVATGGTGGPPPGSDAAADHGSYAWAPGHPHRECACPAGPHTLGVGDPEPRRTTRGRLLRRSPVVAHLFRQSRPCPG